jgi:hypothetical protein
MVDENRLDTLQDEIKLLKAEVKNSLASVRDYLLNMELPSSEFSTILAALAGDNADPQKMNVDSHVSDNKAGNMPQPDFTKEKPDNAEENLANETGQSDEFEEMLDFEDSDKADEASGTQPDENLVNGEKSLPEQETLPTEGEKADDELSDEAETDEEDILPEDELKESEDDENIGDDNDELADEEPELPLEEVQPMESDRIIDEINRGIPKVNMLANLIVWVARVRQEIGYEQLPALLEVYGTSGHLSLELKDIIIQLAEIMKDHSEATTESEIWSESILSLHGILTGGDAPLNPVIPSWVDTTDETESLSEDEIIEVDKRKEKSAKLKLVFPNGDGKIKEFCINLAPEDNGDS